MRTNANPKKLRLNSETLRYLDKPALGRAMGGATPSNGTVCENSVCGVTSCLDCDTLTTCKSRYC
jgi:hypothetical protein